MRIEFFSLLVASLAVLGLGVAGPARSDDPHANAAEKAMIPPWCAFATSARKTANSWQRIKDPSMRAKIYDLDNSGCNGYHHYCWALVWTNRGIFREPEDTRPVSYYYEAALDDFNYVYGVSEPGEHCKLFPEMYTKGGEIRTLLNQPAEAEKSFRKALSLKPTYAPAYIGLSDLYEMQGAPDKAIAALQQGIKVNPQSTALKKKLQRVEQRVASSSAEISPAPQSGPSPEAGPSAPK